MDHLSNGDQLPG